MTSDGVELFNDQRIDTKHTHGTGCTLASSLAAGLAAGMGMTEAVQRARDYVRAAILQHLALGRDTVDDHGHPLRRVSSSGALMSNAIDPVTTSVNTV